MLYFHTAVIENRIRNIRSPCSLCQSLDHGVWFFKEFHDKRVDERLQFAKKRKLFCRCLATDHKRKDCRKARICGIGCPRNHHRLLHGLENLPETAQMTTFPHVDEERRPVVLWERVPVVTMTSCNAGTPTESYSLRTVPVWMKPNGRKVKINAFLDDASNETFLNEEIAGVLEIQEHFRKVQVHVLNDTVVSFSPCQ